MKLIMNVICVEYREIKLCAFFGVKGLENEHNKERGKNYSFMFI